MKDYGHLLRDDPEWAERAAAFSRRVRDVTELLTESGPAGAPSPGAAAGRLSRRLPPGTRAGRALAAARAAADRSRSSSWSSPPAGSSAAAPPASTTCSSPTPRPSSGERKARNLLDTGAEAVIAGNPGCALQIAAHSEGGAAARGLSPDGAVADFDRGREPERRRAMSASRSGGPLGRSPSASTRSSPTTRSPSSPSSTSASSRGARSAAAARRAPRRASTPAGRSTSSTQTREVREDDGWRRRAAARDDLAGPPGRDHRADRPQDGDQRAQLRRPRVHGGLRGLELADLGEHGRRPAQPLRRDRPARSSSRRRMGQAVPARRRGRDPARPPARLAPARAAPDGRRPTGRRRTVSTSASTSSATRGRCSTPAAARTSTCRRWRAISRRGSGTRCSSSRRSGSGSSRGTIQATVLIETLPGRVRDGGDPLRAPRPLRRAERRPLGLHVLGDQVLPRPARVRAPGPQLVTMTVAVHARLHRAAGEDLPPARRARDRRDGRVHPLRNDPEANEAAMAKLREDKGREAADGFDGSWVAHPDWSAPARRSSTGCSASGRTRSTAGATTSRSPLMTCSTWPRPRASARVEGLAQRRQRRHPVHLVVAARQRRRRASTG